MCTVSTALLLGSLMAAPAGAQGVWVNARGGLDPAADGSVCAELTMAGPITGVITADGLVRTERPAPVVVDVQRRQFAGPTDQFTAQEAFTTVYDHVKVCLGGFGRAVIGGYAVFTLNAHGAGSDVVEVLVCSYSKSGPSCV